MKKVYASVIARLIEAGTNEAEAFEKVLAHLEARGRKKLLHGIRRELQSALARRKLSQARLEVASEAEAHAAMKEAKELGMEALHAEVNPSLIRGWRARKSGVLVDRSGKRALVDLYRNIVKA